MKNGENSTGRTGDPLTHLSSGLIVLRGTRSRARARAAACLERSLIPDGLFSLTYGALAIALTRASPAVRSKGSNCSLRSPVDQDARFAPYEKSDFETFRAELHRGFGLVDRGTRRSLTLARKLFTEMTRVHLTSFSLSPLLCLSLSLIPSCFRS